MLTFNNVVKILSAALLISIAAPIFAESAPVYDADSMQQDDGMSDQSQYMPPPPPNQEGSAFIPVQPTISSAPSAQTSNVEQRIQRLEQQISSIQNTDGSPAHVDSLQSQVQALRGQVEQLSHQLEQLQVQQKTMYSDLDGRLAQTGSKPVNLAPPIPPNSNAMDAVNANAAAPGKTPAKTNKPTAKLTPKATTNQPNVAEEQQIYQTAYNLIKAKKYSDAVNALQGMLKKYPSGQFASNAHYWLGELYGLMGKNDQALVEFSTVVETYPDSPRVSDAQLKVGLLFASQSKWSDSKSALKKVINHYPGTASARVATEQLKQIKLAGH